MVFGIIYMIICKINKKIYVDQTTRTLEERFVEHFKADSILRRNIREFGEDNFSREVLAECKTQEELDEQERI